MNVNNGIINQLSPYAVTETIDRFVVILKAKGITLFARIDQQAEAEKVDATTNTNLCPIWLMLKRLATN